MYRLFVYVHVGDTAAYPYAYPLAPSLSDIHIPYQMTATFNQAIPRVEAGKKPSVSFWRVM